MNNTKTFQTMKIRCPHSVDSEMIQKELFKLGYFWEFYNINTIQHKHKPFIYAECNGQLSFGEREDYFNEIGFKEVNIQDLKQMNDKKVFKEMKFKVSSACQSELIQRELFKLGYQWHSNKTSLSYTEKPFLYANPDGNIAFGEYDCHFYDSTFPEFQLKQKFEFEEVEVLETPESIKKSIISRLSANHSIDKLKQVLNSL